MTVSNDILLEEIRLNRKKIDKIEENRVKDMIEVRKEINSVKLKLATFTSTISVIFGFIGASVREVLFKK